MSRKRSSIKTEKTLHGVVCNCLTLNIRSLPSIESEICGLLHAGDEVEVIQTFDGWYRTSSGYVMSDYIILK